MEPEIKYHLNVGREFYEAGEYDKARPHLEAVLEQHDGFADVHNMLGVVHYQGGRRESAIGYFEKAVAINPRYTEAALNLSVCYNEVGRYGDAKEVYFQAASRGGGQKSVKASEIEALDTFVRGKIANAHNELGGAYLAVGLSDRAIGEYLRALELAPTFVDIRTRLGTALRDSDQVDDAIAELSRLAGEKSKMRQSAFESKAHGRREYFELDLPGRVQLGLTYWKAGRPEDARSEWNTVLESEPDNRSAKLYIKMTHESE